MNEENLPIQLVEPDPEAMLRYYYNTEDLEESIAQFGQIEAVHVYKNGEKYYVYVGIRRYFAIKRLCDKYGKPCEIKAEIEEMEPDPETKFGRIFQENEKRNDFTLYEKIGFVLFHGKLAEALVKDKIISEHFKKDALSLRNFDVTEEDLKRWLGIEMKVSKKVNLTLGHIRKIAELEGREKRDFAVAVLSYLEVPASLANNINIYLINMAKNERLTKALKEKGIENPYEKEPLPAFKLHEPSKPQKPQQEVLPSPVIEKPVETRTMTAEIPREAIEAPESAIPKEIFQPQKVIPEQTRKAEIKEEAPALEEEEKPVKEEEPPTMVLFRGESSFFAIDGVYVVFYNGAKPEVRLIEITEDGQIVDINGKKFRIKLMNSL